MRKKFHFKLGNKKTFFFWFLNSKKKSKNFFGFSKSKKVETFVDFIFRTPLVLTNGRHPPLRLTLPRAREIVGEVIACSKSSTRPEHPTSSRARVEVVSVNNLLLSKKKTIRLRYLFSLTH